MGIMSRAIKAFGHAYVASLQSSAGGEGTIFQPKTLTRGQLAMYSQEMTETYGHAYTAFTQANARNR